MTKSLATQTLNTYLAVLQKTEDDYFIKNKEYCQVWPNELDGVYTIHVYNGPKGKGYILEIRADESGRNYYKCIDYGVENRTINWTEIIDKIEPIPINEVVVPEEPLREEEII